MTQAPFLSAFWSTFGSAVLSTLLFPLLCGATSPNKAPKIESAWQDSDGELVIRFESDPSGFPAGNTLFFGSERALFQIDSTWSSPTSIHFRDGRIAMDDAKAVLSCGDNDKELARLSGPALTQLESDVQRGKLQVKFLPEIQDPAYLLQVKGSDEFVYITAPRYNFHENFSVYMVRNGRWKKIETIPTPKDPTANTTDLIRFKNGGGVYIPAAIDLFTKSDRDKGSPTLIRHSGGRIEELTRPALKAGDLARIGIRFPRAAGVRTPCIN